MEQQQPNNQPNSRPTPPPYPPGYQPPGKSRWWIPVVVIGAVLGLIFLFFVSVVSMLTSGFNFDSEPVEVKHNSVLTLDFESGLQEYSKSNPFSFGNQTGPTAMLDMIAAIKLAKNDSKIKGIYIKPGFGTGAAKSTEMIEVLEDFKQSGKFIYTFMEVGNESSYYNALVSDSIFMPLEGMIEFNGYGASSVFLAGMFDKLGMKWHVEAFEDFKSAGDSYTEKKFTDSARYQLEVILDQRNRNFASAIAKYRGIAEDKIYADLAEGLYTAEEFLEGGYVDGFMTESQFKDFLKVKLFGEENTDSEDTKDSKKDKKKKEKVNYISAANYMKGADLGKDIFAAEDQKVGLINLVGGISSGKSEPFSSDYEIKSAEVVQQIRKARENKDVKVIILRIDSPGGSVIASDEIWNEVIKTREVKPVIASMSDVAASGGYYIAMACDKIVAHPHTITGSIGVVLAIPNFAGTMNMLGLTADTISTSPSAQFMNGMYNYTEKDLKKLRHLSSTIYKRFVTKAAESRNMSYEQLRSYAKGRVWTGEDAKKIGLVDELGGLTKAIELAKAEMGIDKDIKVRVVSYPEKEDEVKQLLKMFGLDKSGDDDSAKANLDMKKMIAQSFGFNVESFVANYELLPMEVRKQMIYVTQMMKIAQREKVLMASPFLPNFN